MVPLRNMPRQGRSSMHEGLGSSDVRANEDSDAHKPSQACYLQKGGRLSAAHSKPCSRCIATAGANPAHMGTRLSSAMQQRRWQGYISKIVT